MRWAKRSAPMRRKCPCTRSWAITPTLPPVSHQPISTAVTLHQRVNALTFCCDLLACLCVAAFSQSSLLGPARIGALCDDLPSLLLALCPCLCPLGSIAISLATLYSSCFCSYIHRFNTSICLRRERIRSSHAAALARARAAVAFECQLRLVGLGQSHEWQAHGMTAAVHVHVLRDS